MSTTGEIGAVSGLREGEEEQVEKGQGSKSEGSVRRRTLTSKGKEYQASIIKERAESTERKWSSVVSKIK